MTMKTRALMMVCWVALLIAGCAPRTSTWSETELETLRGLWIGTLPDVPPGDLSNTYADDPRAVELGHALFFDEGFSANGEVSCATCHPPESNFRDQLPLSQGIALTRRRSLTVVGAAYNPWFFWDGRKDSLWSQALEPLEDPLEHGTTRMQVARRLAEQYHAEYEAIFGALPDLSDQARFPVSASPAASGDAQIAWEAMDAADQDAVNRVFANFGKAVAAYERVLLPAPSRFDAYVEAIMAGDPSDAQTALSADEVAGLRLFIGEAGCINCHNGPLFTNGEFHNTGIPQTDIANLDAGRKAVIERLQSDTFNCLGIYSDANPEDCGELRFALDTTALSEGGFKVPTLRGVAVAGPYMHTGQMKTLAEVLEHYNNAPGSQFENSYSELIPLRLSQRELRQIEAFLGSLSAPLQVDARWLSPPQE